MKDGWGSAPYQVDVAHPQPGQERRCHKAEKAEDTMHKTAVQGGVSVGSLDRDLAFLLDPDLWGTHCAVFAGGPGQVADRAGDHGDPVTPGGQIARQFMVPGTTGFIEGGKSLVDE